MDTSETTQREGRPERGASRRAACALLLPLLCGTGGSIEAQEPPAAHAGASAVHLTLAEAVEVALRNNPAFQSRRNDVEPAAWAVREAWAAFLPSVSTSLGMSYTGPGVQRIGTLDFGSTPERYYSRYGLTASYALDGASFFRTASSRARLRAVEEEVEAAAFDLRSAVTLQYMATLRAREGVTVATQQLERSLGSLELVRIRVDAGAAARVELRQAEVQAGRDEASLVRAERDLRSARLLLMEQLGTLYPEGLVLESEFDVFEPRWTLEELLESALERHPRLRALQASERAGRASVREVQSDYLPTVSLSATLSGSSLETGDESFLLENEQARLQSRRESCELMNRISAGLSEPLPGRPEDCSGFVLTDDVRRRILSENDVFPFEFTENPLAVNLIVSLPVFTGFSRQRRIEEAQAGLRDAAEARRAEELRLRTAVTRYWDDLLAALRLVEIESRNREVAEEQLALARQRYALGATGILELQDAQTSVATAEEAYLNAVYDFHTALASLEAAVGRSLREA